MVLAGDQLDASMKAMLGLGTMYAAGVGNALSDALGEGAGGKIESLFGGGEVPPEIANSRLIRGTAKVAPIIGIFLGCLVGMLFLPLKRMMLGANENDSYVEGS